MAHRHRTRFSGKAIALMVLCGASLIALGLIFAKTMGVSGDPGNQVSKTAEERKDKTSLKNAASIRPAPSAAKNDRSLLHADGCLVDRPITKSPECVYGKPSSETTVVLFGDSHALLYFPALRILAHENDWRLVGLTKGGCSPAEVHIYSQASNSKYPECDEWREQTLKRIAEKERPDMIVTSTRPTYQVLQDGEKLRGRTRDETLKRGYVSTLEKLRRTGAEVVVIKDIPHPDKNIPECVARSPRNPENCAIPRSKAFDYLPINALAAMEVEGVRLIDPTPVLCNEKACPAVIGDVLIYRNGTHLTATHGRTLAPWLGERLPDPAASR